ncbi:hypothetical protein [Staphylococcus xylosus]|uniref:hypothetical protein n=1 Tax=Staphylococcus xylosus TaxID=1288 RepID=UPI001C1E3C45|nr:hypothetical protein [Staphylococcus xylosus]MBU6132133.1 hypothetical protein [Staphylococcus xylosus]
MRYHLEVRRYSEEWHLNHKVNEMDVVYGKYSDDKQELEDIIEKYKREDGQKYCVEISDTEYSGEGIHVTDNKVYNKSNIHLPVIKLDRSIEKLD